MSTRHGVSASLGSGDRSWAESEPNRTFVRCRPARDWALCRSTGLGARACELPESSRAHSRLSDPGRAKLRTMSKDSVTPSRGLQLRSLVRQDGRLQLSLEDVPVPDPGPDEVLVRV